MDITVLNSKDLGSMKEITTRFVYNNEVSVDKTWKIQSSLPSGSIIKPEGDRMQNLYNRYSSHSSSLSGSLTLSTGVGNTTFQIFSSSFNYFDGEVTTFITASQLLHEIGRSGEYHTLVTRDAVEYTQNEFNTHCISLFLTGSEE